MRSRALQAGIEVYWPARALTNLCSSSVAPFAKSSTKSTKNTKHVFDDTNFFVPFASFVVQLLHVIASKFRRQLLRWYRKNGRDLPWRRTNDPYDILVSEFMLPQTQVTTVLPYYKEWLRRIPGLAGAARARGNHLLP